MSTRELPSRRTFVKGLAAGTAAASAGLMRSGVRAQGSRIDPAVLTGTQFDLTIGDTRVNITGRERSALTINGSLPGPLLRWREGDTVTLRVRNTLDEDTSIHWHGILLPANMDGVPGLSFHGIRPGETFTYRFVVKQSGTYWYHSHSGFQEQLGVYGPLIVEPRERDPLVYDREHVVMLTDWTDEDPRRVFAKLKKQSDYYNDQRRTAGDFVADVRANGLGATLGERLMWGRMRMSATDIADVSGATYTYLMNGQSPAANWTGLFAAGERVRLRFINGSAMTYFDVRIPGVTMTVVAADGQPVSPVPVDEFRIAVAETFDVIIEPSGVDAFTIFAQAMDRSGFAAGTLAVRAGARAEVPAPDSRPVLTMADMGHGRVGAAADGAAVDPHAGHVMPGPEPLAAPVTANEHAAHGGAPPSVASHTAGGVVAHPATERGNPLVDMQADAPVSKLDDPGLGLRGTGRRVLTYADLRSTFADPDGREPSRTIELHLTGHMERFAWSFNGVRFADAEPLRLTYGERVRVVLVNDTMMAHPIHLHGMWSDLEDDAGRFLVRKHTIDMPPGSRRSYRVTADAIGRWAYHCHMMLHMEAGMFRELRVEEASASCCAR
jgi:CopA family copper-resistance protein